MTDKPDHGIGVAPDAWMMVPDRISDTSDPVQATASQIKDIMPESWIRFLMSNLKSI